MQVTNGVISVTNITLSTSISYLVKKGNIVTLTFWGSAQTAIDRWTNIGTIPSGFRPQGYVYIGEGSNIVAAIMSYGSIQTYKALSSGDMVCFTTTYVAVN